MASPLKQFKSSNGSSSSSSAAAVFASASSTSLPQAYHGEHPCQGKSLKGKPCPNKAYWTHNHLLLCGVHSKKWTKERLALPKRSVKEYKQMHAQKRLQEEQHVATAQTDNVKHGRGGRVILTRLRMRQAPRDVTGFRKVFPNNKHGTRSDGVGCATLSPMQLGPVDHKQPGLPPAQNIENFHQGSKCFEQELGPDGKSPGPEYYKNRLAFYLDKVPHRHKFTGTDKTNKNIPKYFVYVDAQGQEHHLDYITSRQFYCTIYERLVSDKPEFKQLQQWLAEGINLQLVGYDAHPMKEGQSIEQAYLDPTLPFGHERVLYAMLTLSDPAQRPWNKHRTFVF